MVLRSLWGANLASNWMFRAGTPSRKAFRVGDGPIFGANRGSSGVGRELRAELIPNVIKDALMNLRELWRGVEPLFWSGDASSGAGRLCGKRRRSPPSDQPQMFGDFLDFAVVLDEGNDFHLPRVSGAEERIDFKDSFRAGCPALRRGRGCS